MPAFQICIITLTFLLAACGGGGNSPSTTTPPIITNLAPVVSAGPDTDTYGGRLVELSGSASDSDGSIQSTAWTQISGPSVTLDAANQLSTTFLAPIVESATDVLLQLAAIDDDDARSTDIVTVTVLPLGSAPSADAGSSQVVAVGALVQLDGSGSFDADGDALSYQWTIQQLPANSAAALDDPTSATPTFVADVTGDYQVVLVVSDNIQSSLAASVDVISGTPVGGVSSGDVTLVSVDSPYVLTEALQIPYGSSLMAGEGVAIFGKGNDIVVGGVLQFSGTVQGPVEVVDTHIRPASGPDTDWYQIELAHVRMKGGSLYQPTGNAVYGGLSISDSFLEDLSGYIYLWYPKIASTIERNVFVRSGGISTGTLDVNVTIRNNVFVEQSTNFAIQNWASYSGTMTLVQLNSFLSTDRIALLLPPGYTDVALNGANNYWGTTDTLIVESMIYDQNDDIEVTATVEYNPILTSPDAETPSYP